LLSVSRFCKELVYFAERRSLLGNLGCCGQDLRIAPPWDIRVDKYVFIGRDVYIGPNVVILADKGAEIHIGDKVMFGPQVKLIANDHKFDDPTRPIKDCGYAARAGIRIGNDVWIGAGATILKGVHVGEGSVIGASSVVTREVGNREVWAGNPARKIRDRFESDGSL
jgi:acetyltransferase-like isoleucine patch superfamily enzyme